jgi:glutamate dehydrogenase (NADP+)
MTAILEQIEAWDPQEIEFRQAVKELVESVQPLLEQTPEYEMAGVLERLVEPERVLSFRVPWVDDRGKVQVNRGYRVEMSSAVGPYKGGLRFHPSVNLSIMKFMAFEQVFKNALTTMPLGGAAGGSNFDPKGKSDNEIMRFCQAFMGELHRHIGPSTDILAADIGVGAREIGYLFGTYRRLRNEFSGAMTGKGTGWGGSLMRPQGAGYGCVYFAAEMLATRHTDLANKTCLVSGSGNVAQSTVEKLIEMGARVLTLSDSSGFIYDGEGIDAEKLAQVRLIKNVRRGRIKEYVERYPEAIYTPLTADMESNPLWRNRADCAFPCATQNEINEPDAYHLINNNIKLVAEGASMPCTPRAIDILMGKRILFGPNKATGAGGAALSGLEMAQNNMRLSWSREEVDQRLRLIMREVHQTCLDTAERYGTPGNYINGANIAAFNKVVGAMQDQGVV